MENTLNKNDIVTVKIQDLSHEGLGIAKINNIPIFIENTLPEEEVKIKIVHVKKNLAYGKVLEFLTYSAYRNHHADMSLQKGIAPLIHMNYEYQLQFKFNNLNNMIHKYMNNYDIKVYPVQGMEHPTHYRNKAQVPIHKIDGTIEFGFYQKKSHHFIPTEDYFIQEELINETLKKIKSILNQWNVSVYNESTNTGNFRHVIVRKGHYSNELMVVLVTRKKFVPNFNKIVQDIIEYIPQITTIVHNINPEQTNVILGKESLTVYGEGYITDTLLDHTYQISAHSFYQVNTIQAERLYQKAIDLCELEGKEIVFDLYCGIGTIGLSFAPFVDSVYGVEIISDAVKDAKRNAAINYLSNTKFECGSADKIVQKWKNEHIDPNIVIVDPPRKGLTPELIDTILTLDPQKIVYISCNPATLMRDLKLIANENTQYTFEEIYPFDMFPYTYHVECLVLMSRVEK